jgi:hypothetical protein
MFSFAMDIIVVLFAYRKIHASELQKDAMNVTGMSKTSFP